MTAIEELQKREKSLALLLRVFFVILILIGLFLIGFIVSFVWQSDASLAQPTGRAGALVLGFRCGYVSL
jgi:hypothetical protein